MFCPIIDLTKQLIRCPSISPNDAGCQKLLVNRLQAIGFKIELMNFKDTKNFWATRGTGETVVLAGHTDVVPPGNLKIWKYLPFEPTIINGCLFGRGAADMKGAIAAMIVAVERLVKKQPYHKGRIGFLITSDEESHAQNGTRKVVENLLKRHEKIDYCIIGEPTSTKIIGDVIKHGRRGSISAHLTIYGKQGHVAYSHLANNPIHSALPLLNKLINTEWDKGNEFFPPTTIQISNIKSGTGNYNIIPEEVSIKFNLRFSTEITAQKICEYINFLLKTHNLNHEIKWYFSAEPFITQKGKLVNVVIQTVMDYNNIKPQLLTTGGTSDGRFITHMTAQIVELGAINATIHQINEFVKVSDLQNLSLIYQKIIEELIIN